MYGTVDLKNTSKLMRHTRDVAKLEKRGTNVSERARRLHFQLHLSCCDLLLL